MFVKKGEKIRGLNEVELEVSRNGDSVYLVVNGKNVVSIEEDGRVLVRNYILKDNPLTEVYLYAKTVIKAKWKDDK